MSFIVQELGGHKYYTVRSFDTLEKAKEFIADNQHVRLRGARIRHKGKTIKENSK